MCYSKRAYKRLKKWILKKICNCPEEYEAFKKIKDKWGFNDLEISKLLKTNTVTEILEWKIHLIDLFQKN